jgi:hypothetical protein
MDYLSILANKIRAKLEPSLIPEQNVSQLFRIYAVLTLAKGQAVTLADVHNAWVAWMVNEDPDHPALQPFDELDRETASADEPFQAAIIRAAMELDLESG